MKMRRILSVLIVMLLISSYFGNITGAINDPSPPVDLEVKSVSLQPFLIQTSSSVISANETIISPIPEEPLGRQVSNPTIDKGGGYYCSIFEWDNNGDHNIGVGRKPASGGDWEAWKFTFVGEESIPDVDFWGSGKKFYGTATYSDTEKFYYFEIPDISSQSGWEAYVVSFNTGGDTYNFYDSTSVACYAGNKAIYATIGSTDAGSGCDHSPFILYEIDATHWQFICFPSIEDCSHVSIDIDQNTGMVYLAFQQNDNVYLLFNEYEDMLNPVGWDHWKVDSEHNIRHPDVSAGHGEVYMTAQAYCNDDWDPWFFFSTDDETLWYYWLLGPDFPSADDEKFPRVSLAYDSEHGNIGHWIFTKNSELYSGPNDKISQDTVVAEHYRCADVAEGHASWTETDAYTIYSSVITVGGFHPIPFIDSISPNPAGTGETVYFDGHGWDPDGWIIGYEWESDLDGVISTQSSFNKNDLSKGVHTISFTVEDNNNHWSSAAKEELEIINLPPYTPDDPSPPDGATNIPTSIILQWVGGDPDGDPVTYDVYFGTTNPPPKVVNNQSETYYIPDPDYDTTYYWKIVSWDDHDNHAEGPVWHFTMKSAPYTVFKPLNATGNMDYPYPFADSYHENQTSILEHELNDVKAASGANKTSGIIGGYTYAMAVKEWTDEDAKCSAWQNVTFYTGQEKNVHVTVELSLLESEFDIGYDTHGEIKIGHETEASGIIWDIIVDPYWDWDNFLDILFMFMNLLGFLPGPIIKIMSWICTFGQYYLLYQEFENFYLSGDADYYTLEFDMVTNNGDYNTISAGIMSSVDAEAGWEEGGTANSTFLSQIFNITIDGIAPPGAPVVGGPTTGYTSESYEFSAVGYDPNDDQIRYGWDWNGDGIVDEWTAPANSGTTVSISHTWNDPGDYTIKVRSRDTDLMESDVTNYYFSVLNRPPGEPTIRGPIAGKIGTPYDYTFISVDPDGNDVFYWIDWDDGQGEDGIGPFNSGEKITVDHTWNTKGTYNITAIAKDTHGAESEEGSWTVMMPKNTGCVQETLINMAYGSFPPVKNIEDIEVGDYISSYDTKLQMVVPAEVTAVYNYTELPETPLDINYNFENNIGVAPDLLLFINGTEWMEANDTEIYYDVLENTPGTNYTYLKPITSINESLTFSGVIYDLEIKPLESGNISGYFADGILVGERIPPEITNVSSTPSTVGFGFNVTITADVIDGINDVDAVAVNIRYPDDSMSNFSMANTGNDTYGYCFNDIWLVGSYNYTIWAIDKSQNINSSTGHIFNVSSQAIMSVCTLKDEYSNNEYINITDPPPPEDPPSEPSPIGYELLDDNKVLHIWNKFDSYYFNTSSGIQLTNYYNEYWSHNVLMLGYYNNDEWNLIYRTDELSGFNKNIETDNETYVNATLWKDLTYDGYDFRLAIRYHLGIDDNELTVIPYIKNLGDAIPYVLGFAWEIKDIQIDMTPENDYIEINDTSFYLNEPIDVTYTNLSDARFRIKENVDNNRCKDLYLKWNKSVPYKVLIRSREGQYNAPVTLAIRIGTLAENQEKQVNLFWHDASFLEITVNSTNDTYLRKHYPGGNYGDEEYMWIDSKLTQTNRMLVQMDMPGELNDAYIGSATLMIYYDEYSGINPENREHECWRIEDLWDEYDVDWGSQPGLDGVVDTITLGGAYGYKSWDGVKDNVQDFIEGDLDNYGWLLGDKYENTAISRAAKYYSREQGGSDYIPKIVIEYLAPPETQTNPVTNVEESQLRFNGKVIDDGGDECQYSFSYDVWIGGESASDSTNWTGGYNTDESFFVYFYSLDEGRHGTYNAQLRHSVYPSVVRSGTPTGFLTKPDTLTGFTATAYEEQVNLTWSNNDGGDGAYIEWFTSSDDSWNPGDHTKVGADGNVTGESFIHENRIPGTPYYYKAWAYADDAGWRSSGNSSAPFGDIPKTANTTTGVTTSVDAINPYTQASNPSTVTASGSPDLDNVSLCYRYSIDNTWEGESWWNSDWDYRKVLNINDKIDEYQLKLVVSNNSGGDVSCNGHVQSDFDDIRFISNTGNEIPYWRENYTAETQAAFWINNIYNDSNILIYYGNSIAASTTSNGNDTWIFFDDFNTGTEPDSEKWYELNENGGDCTVSDGQLKCDGAYIWATRARVYSNTYFNVSNSSVKGYRVKTRITDFTTDVADRSTYHPCTEHRLQTGRLGTYDDYSKFTAGGLSSGLFRVSAPYTVDIGIYKDNNDFLFRSYYNDEEKTLSGSPTGDGLFQLWYYSFNRDHPPGEVSKLYADWICLGLFKNTSAPYWGSFGSEQEISDWAEWNNPDTSSPWQWEFDFPEGKGYYEFYSIGTKNDIVESAPSSADAQCFYENQSKINNTGSTDIKGYLLMQVHYFNETLEEWIVADDTVNETMMRVINAEEQFGLDTIFNGRVNTNDLLEFGSGTYRVYAAFRDSDGNVLVDDDGTAMTASYEFNLMYAMPLTITNVFSNPDTVGFGFNVTISADVTDSLSGIDVVKVNITYPDDSSLEYPMSHTTGDTYEYTFSNTWLVGQYNYTIWAVDNAENTNSSSGHSFNVFAQAKASIQTLQDEYGSNEYINLTDPPEGGHGDKRLIGYELLDNNTVLHLWNKHNDYYFNVSNGIQFTNHYEEYWTRNVLMLGYYAGGEWNLIYRTDELSGFNRDIDTDNETYVNATLWKDLTYDDYSFRLAIRYYLGVNDSDLTVIPYIKNLGDAIPYILGFGWELKDIQIDATVENDQIRVNNTRYFLNQTLDIKYTNTSGEFYLEEIDNKNPAKYLYLKWNHSLNYLVWVKTRDGQYNAPVTLFIRVGTLDSGQEKSTVLHWLDAEGDFIESWYAEGPAPGGIATDGNYIWIVDNFYSEVHVYTMDGYWIDYWDIECNDPYGITTDGNYIWIVDNYYSEVHVYTMDGYWIDYWDISECDNPYGITTDGNYIWIVDNYYNEVHVYTMDGYWIDYWDIYGYYAHGITTDGSYIWIVDSYYAEVSKYEMNGYYTDIHWDTNGCGNEYPLGITNDGVYFWITDASAEVYKYEGPGTAGDLYERYNTGDDDWDYASNEDWIGQTFTVGNTGVNEEHSIISVKLKLFRYGLPGTITVSIRETDEYGEPTGGDLTSGTTNGDTLTEDDGGEWREITLTPYTLSESTKYAIVVRALEGDPESELNWRADWTEPTYTGGSLIYSGDSGSSWDLDEEIDFMFETYGEEPTIPLDESVDNYELSWTTGGNANWFGQSQVYYYDNDAAESGDINNNQNTWIKTTVTGPGFLKFYWKVNSEQNWDYLRFYIDDFEQTKISGDVDWQEKTYNITSGPRELMWKYTKDSSVSIGSDCGWLDFTTYYITQSKIKNTGSTDIKGYLLIQVQHFNETLQQWVVADDTVNKTTSTIINSSEQLALDQFFNDEVNTNDLVSFGSGMYRVYTVFRDPYGNILKCDDETELVATYEFDISFS